MSGTRGARISVVIVDDHPVFRLGLRSALAGTELDVVGEAATAQEAVAVVAGVRPQVVLLDLGLPDRDGFAVCRELRDLLPDAVVVMLSSYDDAATIRASRLAGARGHLTKDAPIATLVDVVGALVRDAARSHFPDPARLGLTERELDVLEGMALGLQQPEIAARLGIGVETVKSYVRAVYDKLGVNDRADALEVARARKLIGAPPSGGYRG